MSFTKVTHLLLSVTAVSLLLPLLLLLSTMTVGVAAQLSSQTVVQVRAQRALLIDAGRQQVLMWGNNNDGLINPVPTTTNVTAERYVTVPTMPPAYDKIRARAGGVLLGGCMWNHGVCLSYTSGQLWCWEVAAAGDVWLHSDVQRNSSAYNIYEAPYVLNDTFVRHTQVSCGAEHLCSLLDTPFDNVVWCHGRNDMMQLGAAADVRQMTYRFDEPVLQIGSGTPEHSMCAQLARTLGQVCWGDNRQAQLGMDSDALALPIGAQRLNLPRDTVHTLVAGAEHWCALYGGSVPSIDGAVKCWGNNKWNQLGTLSPRASEKVGGTLMPLAATMFASPQGNTLDIHQVYAGGFLSCITWPRGNPVNVTCLGRNVYGEAGHADRNRTELLNFFSSLSFPTIPGFADNGNGLVRGMALSNGTTLMLLERQPGAELTLSSYGINTQGLLGVGSADESLRAPSSAQALPVASLSPTPAPTPGPTPAPTPVPTPPTEPDIFVPLDRAPPAWNTSGDMAVIFDDRGRRPDYQLRRLLVDRNETCFSRDQFVVYFSYVEQVLRESTPDGWRVLSREPYPWGGYAVTSEVYEVSTQSVDEQQQGKGNVTRVRFEHRFPVSNALLQHINALLSVPPSSSSATALFDMMGDGRRTANLTVGVHKLAVRISEWSTQHWLHPEAQLRLIFGVRAMNGTHSRETTTSSSTTTHSFEHQSGTEGIRLSSAFEQTAVVDGRDDAAVSVHSMPDGSIGVVLPRFESDLFYDPNFAVLTSPSSSSDKLDYRCSSGKLVAHSVDDGGGISPTMMIIVICATIVGAVVLVVGVALYTGRHRLFPRLTSKLSVSGGGGSRSNNNIVADRRRVEQRLGNARLSSKEV